MVLLPFYTTNESQQLSGLERDKADQAFRAARQDACGAAAAIISLGIMMEEAQSTEMPDIATKVRAILPSQAPSRVHRSYSWLMLATLKVKVVKCIMPQAHSA